MKHKRFKKLLMSRGIPRNAIDLYMTFWIMFNDRYHFCDFSWQSRYDAITSEEIL